MSKDSFKTTKGTVISLMNLKGKPYMQVAQRLVWFREEYPGHLGSIRTKLVKFEEPDADKSGYAIYEASIYVSVPVKQDDGTTKLETFHIGSGTKMESEQHFTDFLEKAETGAIGRALASAGFGTQFASEDLDEGARIVDSPTTRAQKAPSPTSGFKPASTGSIKGTFG